MKDVAILYMCSGSYIVFWKDFYDSSEKYFLPNSNKEYFVFTDAKDIYQGDNERVHVVYQEPLGWPGASMYRFHIFLGVEDRLKEYKYLFFMNANNLFVDYVTEEDFLPKRDCLVVVQHPGFYDKPIKEYSYDRNPRCSAYIPYRKGKYYVCGGINGGTSAAFLRMCHCLKERTEKDDKRKIYPLWYDESQINRYIVDYPDYELKSPSYWYVEEYGLPFQPKIIVRDKAKWLDMDKVKPILILADQDKQVSNIEKLKKLIRKILRR